MTEYYPPPKSLATPMRVVEKTLLGPGPSNAPQRVLDGMARQLMGHLHPETLALMDEIKAGCQYIFQTKNKVTLCISATGHAGIEAGLCNLLEEGDTILLGVTGIWAHRASDMARRYGAEVKYLEVPQIGMALSLEQIEAGLKLHKPSVLFLAQGDSSSGVLQPLEGVGDLCRRYDCILLVDTVASLGGTPFFADKWKIDVVYTTGQKVLGAPPGITPISFNERAMAKVGRRKTPIKVYYFDINLLSDYWDCSGRPRIYHHTISATLVYGLRESLAILCEEGLDACIKRHQAASKRLQKGVEALGLQMLTDRPEHRMPTVNVIKVPNEVDWKKVTDHAMSKYLVEISGGLGPTFGKVFRIGLMGINATDEHVDLALKVLKDSLESTSSFVAKK